MNINEFLELKEGDRIANPMSNSSGTVASALLDRRGDKCGVTIMWDGTGPDQARAFTTSTTAWMHWTHHDAA